MYLYLLLLLILLIMFNFKDSYLNFTELPYKSKIDLKACS